MRPYSVVLSALMLCASNSVRAEFFVWVDEAGVKHVSTHPKECIGRKESGRAYSLCPPMSYAPEALAAYKHKEKARDCEELQVRRDAMLADLKDARKLVVGKTFVVRPFLSQQRVPEIFMEGQEKYFEVDRQLDDCYPPEQLAARKQARDELRVNFKYKPAPAQNQQLRGIENDLSDIKREMRIP